MVKEGDPVPRERWQTKQQSSWLHAPHPCVPGRDGPGPGTLQQGPAVFFRPTIDR